MIEKLGSTKSWLFAWTACTCAIGSAVLFGACGSGGAGGAAGATGAAGTTGAAAGTTGAAG
ncbi:MAG TPA: hypothetical protein VJ860_03080, partial [Polyangia bacterium]|nr:hypothetical protein [Polyangia bacterium]